MIADNQQQQINSLLAQDYFTLFAIAPSYVVNLDSLHNQFLTLQKQFHPDRFINKTDALNTAVLLLSAHINQGYTTLKSPLQRGVYLLAQLGVKLDLAHDTQLPQQFLLQQIEVHDQIEHALENNSIKQLDVIKDELATSELELIGKLEQFFANQDYAQASEALKQLAFYNRLKSTLLDAYEQI